MKLIHLSDLHIGKRLNELSLAEDQKYILDQIIGIVREEAPDAVIIAGDLYDKSTPTAEAVRLCDDFLCTLASSGCAVAVISGNHDSAEQVAFGERLMGAGGVHISPVYDGSVKCVSLTDEHGPADIWLLPFIKPIHVRTAFPEKEITSYTDAVRVAVEHIPLDPSRRNILVTHQFVTGASRCDSEQVSVGGTDNVDASAFESFDYVALGHLHTPQSITRESIRYCGSPLKYSFSEAGGSKSVTVVELAEKDNLTIREMPLIPLRDMAVLRGDFASLSRRACSDPVRDPFTHITLTDEDDIPDAFNRLRIVYPNLLGIKYDNTRTRSRQDTDIAVDSRQAEPIELLEKLFERQCNQPMSQRQRELAERLIEKIREGMQ